VQNSCKFPARTSMYVVRGFASAAGELVVQIQHMGESITEGEIAVVLVKEGDAVSTDEVIAQIETDKVTLDVRAPTAGLVQAVKVAAGDTVVEGQAVVVLNVGEEAAAAAASEAASHPTPLMQPAEPETPPATTAPSAAPAAASTPPPPHAAPSRTPMIRFPPRRLPDGTRIADLPAAEAQAATARLAGQGAQGAPGGAASANAGGPIYRPAGGAHGDPPRKPLSEKEIAAIELGGAEPYELPPKKRTK